MDSSGITMQSSCVVGFMVMKMSTVLSSCISTLSVPQSLADASIWFIDLHLGMPALIKSVLTGDAATLDRLVDLSGTIAGIVFVVYVALCAINLFLATAESIRDHHSSWLTLPKASSVLGVKIPKEIADVLNAVRGPVQATLLDPV